MDLSKKTKTGNILAGIIEDATWNFIVQFMARYNVLIKGGRDGNQVEAVLSWPKYRLELKGRIVRTEEKTGC